MQLKNIDKQRYSKHYRMIFWGVIAFMLVVSVATSSILIQFFGAGLESNFWLNVAGVVVSALLVASIFRSYKTHPFMDEIMYVWELKKTLNYIYRKQAKIKPQMEQGNITAMTIMHFNYQASKQLFTLDNNTITMDDLGKRIDELEALQEKYQVELKLEDFDVELLKQF